MHISDQKNNLRQAIKDRLARMTDGQRQAESRSVCRRVLEQLPPDPVPVCVYAALKSEVDLRLLIDELRTKGYPLYFPRFEGGALAFRRADDPASLTPGSLGILEPPETAPLLDPSTLAIAIIPARAYAADGRRLGRGNGGYDIWIRKQRTLNPRTRFWGVAFEAQIAADIPMEGHDEKVDMVITARG